MTESVQFSGVAGQLGIFARTFMRDSPAAVARAVADAGFDLVQLNLNSFGLPTIPDQDVLASTDFGAVRASFAEHGITIWGVSVTYNTIHPDAGVRHRLTEAACHVDCSRARTWCGVRDVVHRDPRRRQHVASAPGYRRQRCAA